MHVVVVNVSMLAINDNTLWRFLLVPIQREPKTRVHTSRPVAATTWAVRSEGSPMKVITGFAFDLSALSKRRFGLDCAMVPNLLTTLSM
jgi:hypothetical protein